MFAARFFSGSYYARRYFPAVGAWPPDTTTYNAVRTIIVRVLNYTNIVK